MGLSATGRQLVTKKLEIFQEFSKSLDLMDKSPPLPPHPSALRLVEGFGRCGAAEERPGPWRGTAARTPEAT